MPLHTVTSFAGAEGTGLSVNEWIFNSGIGFQPVLNALSQAGSLCHSLPYGNWNFGGAETMNAILTEKPKVHGIAAIACGSVWLAGAAPKGGHRYNPKVRTKRSQ